MLHHFKNENYKTVFFGIKGFSPSSTTASIGCPYKWAIWPNNPKMAKPAKILVPGGIWKQWQHAPFYTD